MKHLSDAQKYLNQGIDIPKHKESFSLITKSFLANFSGFFFSERVDRTSRSVDRHFISIPENLWTEYCSSCFRLLEIRGLIDYVKKTCKGNAENFRFYPEHSVNCGTQDFSTVLITHFKRIQKNAKNICFRWFLGRSLSFLDHIRKISGNFRWKTTWSWLGSESSEYVRNVIVRKLFLAWVQTVYGSLSHEHFHKVYKTYCINGLPLENHYLISNKASTLAHPLNGNSWLANYHQ